MSTPFSCFSFFQEFLLIRRHGAACFEDRFFKRMSSLISQVSLTFVLGRLECNHRCVSDERNLGGGVLVMLG